MKNDSKKVERLSKKQLIEVMSSCLCKNLEGVIFPLQVEAVEDRVDDAVHAFDIHKADHRPGAASRPTARPSLETWPSFLISAQRSFRIAQRLRSL